MVHVGTVISTDGLEEYWENGVRHRIGGPAIIGKDFEEYWEHGLRHRDGGLPAVVCACQGKRRCPTYLHNWKPTKDFMTNYVLKQTWATSNHQPFVPRPTKNYPCVHEEWWTNGVRNRIGGPAVSCAGYQEYWENGLRHRIDGWVIGFSEGLEWRVFGKRHCIDGPAVFVDNLIQWWEEGQLNRAGGPASIYFNPTETVVVEIWFELNKKHREDGPAYVKRCRGRVTKEWWTRGVRSTSPLLK